MATSASKIIKALGRESLSRSLRKALRLADRLNAKEFLNWCRLELGGYVASNPAMTDQIVVPEYRTVVGQHADIYGRVLMVPADLSFMNETRLRNGVEELEALSTSRDTVAMCTELGSIFVLCGVGGKGLGIVGRRLNRLACVLQPFRYRLAPPRHIRSGPAILWCW